MRTTEFRWVEVRVGLFVAITGILLFAGVVYVGLVGTPFARTVAIHTELDSAAGLAVGSPVEMGGVVIGEVGTIDLPNIETGRVPVRLNVKPQALRKIGASSEAFTASHALVGRRYIGITPRQPDEPPAVEGTMLASRPTMDLSDLVAQLETSLGEISEMTTGFAEAGRSLARTLNLVERGEGTVGRLVATDELYERLDATTRAVQEVAQLAANGSGPLPMLLRDERMANELRRSTRTFAQAADRVSQGQGVLGRLTTDEASAAKVDRTLANLETVSARLADAEGTLGGLIADPTLLVRLNAVTAELDALLMDVRRNPDRYLRVQAF